MINGRKARKTANLELQKLLKTTPVGAGSKPITVDGVTGLPVQIAKLTLPKEITRKDFSKLSLPPIDTTIKVNDDSKGKLIKQIEFKSRTKHHRDSNDNESVIATDPNELGYLSFQIDTVPNAITTVMNPETISWSVDPRSIHQVCGNTQTLAGGQAAIKLEEFKGKQLPVQNTNIKITTDLGKTLAENVKLKRILFYCTVPSIKKGYVSIGVQENEGSPEKEITTQSAPLKIHWN